MLEEARRDKQVITFTTPGTHVEAPATAVAAGDARQRRVRAAMDTRGSISLSLATLPLNDPAASVNEFERATRQLGLPGAMLFSNINGVALSDERFWPIYEAANDSAP